MSFLAALLALPPSFAFGSQERSHQCAVLLSPGVRALAPERGRWVILPDINESNIRQQYDALIGSLPRESSQEQAQEYEVARERLFSALISAEHKFVATLNLYGKQISSKELPSPPNITHPLTVVIHTLGSRVHDRFREEAQKKVQENREQNIYLQRRADEIDRLMKKLRRDIGQRELNHNWEVRTHRERHAEIIESLPRGLSVVEQDHATSYVREALDVTISRWTALKQSLDTQYDMLQQEAQSIKDAMNDLNTPLPRSAEARALDTLLDRYPHDMREELKLIQKAYIRRVQPYLLEAIRNMLNLKASRLVNDDFERYLDIVIKHCITSLFRTYYTVEGVEELTHYFAHPPARLQGAVLEAYMNL